MTQPREWTVTRKPRWPRGSKPSDADRLSPLVIDKPGCTVQPRLVRRQDLQVGNRFRLWGMMRLDVLTVVTVTPDCITVVNRSGRVGWITNYK